MLNLNILASAGGLEHVDEVLGFMAGLLLIGLLASIFYIMVFYKLFVKCGKPGWASIVPIYNIVVMLEICELPSWYVILMFVPFAPIFVYWQICSKFATLFGRDEMFKVILFLFSVIGFAILAFGSDMPQLTDPVTGMPMDQDGNLLDENGMPIDPETAAMMSNLPSIDDEIDAALAESEKKNQ